MSYAQYFGIACGTLGALFAIPPFRRPLTQLLERDFSRENLWRVLVALVLFTGMAGTLAWGLAAHEPAPGLEDVDDTGSHANLPRCAALRWQGTSTPVEGSCAVLAYAEGGGHCTLPARFDVLVTGATNAAERYCADLLLNGADLEATRSVPRGGPNGSSGARTRTRSSSPAPDWVEGNSQPVASWSLP